MKILFLTFYFEPDLCAGSFRNTSLFKELIKNLTNQDTVEVISTHPNRYDSFKVKAKDIETINDNAQVHRIKMPNHGGGIMGQIKLFKKFYFETLDIVKNKEYDLVYASSSRLFTAFLGAKIARKKKAKLYLDIRDIFRETITDLYKNPILKFGLNLILTPIEKYTFGRANHINLVSEGFRSYFNDFKTNYSFFTNGIDEVFLKQREENDSQDRERLLKTIVYGGNIGDGQGLDLILPKVASHFSEEFQFLIIGDGGAKAKLESKIKEQGIQNIKLIPPVKRNELIEYYQKADYLFLHLNNHKAFERVLPSKLFEYGTFNKPIIGGVSGYARLFLKENMKNVILFDPTNSDELIEKMSKYEYVRLDREGFKDKFSRKKINQEMAKSIVNVGEE